LKKSHFLAVGVSAAALFASGVGLTVASVYDWVTTPSGNANSDPGINWAEGMLPSSVNDSARATMAAIAAFLRDATVTTGGAGNAYTATYTQAMRSWSPGYFSFVPNRDNTGAATISRDGLAPKPLRVTSGQALVNGQIKSGSFYIASYSTAGDEVLIGGRLGISNADFAPMSAGTVKANITTGTAQPTDTTLAAFFASAPAGSIPSSAFGSTGLSGEVRAFSVSVCPSGWQTADGTSGSPDLRGTVVRGLDSGRGLDPGRALASYQADSFASHNHGVTDPGHSHSDNIAALNPTTILSGTTAFVTLVANGSSGTSGSATTGITIGNTGGTETRGKNVALLYCYHP
jgi:hypothetical protein